MNQGLVRHGCGVRGRPGAGCLAGAAADLAGARAGDERQPGAGARRHRLRHGDGRDVPDHAGDLGLALPGAALSRPSAASCTRPRTRSRRSASRSAPRYAGKTACTITSGPGLALKTEFLGLRRHGRDAAGGRRRPARRAAHRVSRPRSSRATCSPRSTAQPGDTPKVVLAPATIEECFHFVILARKLAEEFRTPVLVLTDANLATGVAPFPRPKVDPGLDRPPSRPVGLARGARALRLGRRDRPLGAPDPRSARRRVRRHRPRPHPPDAKVAYDPVSNQEGCDMRSRKLAALAAYARAAGAARRPTRATCWSSAGARRSARSRRRSTSCAPRASQVSSLHLRFLSPLEPGLARDLRSASAG